MKNIQWCFIIFIISLIGVYLYRWFAKKQAIYDIPNDRSSHSIPTPRGGGIVIAITWFLSISFLFFRREIDSTLYFALLCGIPISAIGLIDDVITISAKIRLFVQVSSAALAIIILGGIDTIDIGVCYLTIPFIFSVLALLGIVWFTNLFNFLDGIDGYISTEVIFICISVFLLFHFELPLFLAAATAGFLYWNWQPAKIFMGDVGSTLLGFTIGVLAVYSQNSKGSSIIIWLILTSLFWFDASLTLFRRWRNHEQLSKAHKKHAYQRLVKSGMSHQQTVLWALSLNIPILGLAWLGIIFPILDIFLLIVNIAYLYFIMRVVDKRQSFY